MRYLTLREVLEIHRRVLTQSGGTPGVRDLGTVESAFAQPARTCGGQDLYPTIAGKAGARAAC
jgi:death-on-curing protein